MLVWVFTLVALTSASLDGTIFCRLPRKLYQLEIHKIKTKTPYKSSGVRTFFASRSSLWEALPSCGAAQAHARHFASSVDAARVSAKHSRAQAFSQPSRAVCHPRFSCVCAHRASIARVARRGFRPVLPGVAISPSERRKPRHGKQPPGERARVSRASNLSRHASGDWLAAYVSSHFAGHTSAESDPALPAAPVFAVTVPFRFRATQQVAKRTETRSPRRRSARPSRSFVRPSRYA